jgi:hypothetical protein
MHVRIERKDDMTRSAQFGETFAGSDATERSSSVWKAYEVFETI